MPYALPAVPEDAYRKWATDRWTRETDGQIGALDWVAETDQQIAGLGLPDANVPRGEALLGLSNDIPDTVPAPAPASEPSPDMAAGAEPAPPPPSQVPAAIPDQPVESPPAASPALNPLAGQPAYDVGQPITPYDWSQPVPAPPPPSRVDTSTRQGFVDSLMPIARAYEAQTKIPAEALIAAAAHESNWGKAGGNMLFGIKGQGLTTPTWEVYNGVPTNIVDSFQTYNSPAAAFQGFVDLVSQGRYKPAWDRLQQTGGWAQFFRDINAAGYATDPVWGDKIVNVTQNTIAPMTGGKAYAAADLRGATEGSQAHAPTATEPPGGSGYENHPAVQQFSDWLGQQAGGALQGLQDWTDQQAQTWTATGQQAVQGFKDWSSGLIDGIGRIVPQPTGPQSGETSIADEARGVRPAQVGYGTPALDAAQTAYQAGAPERQAVGQSIDQAGGVLPYAGEQVGRLGRAKAEMGFPSITDPEHPLNPAYQDQVSPIYEKLLRREPLTEQEQTALTNDLLFFGGMASPINRVGGAAEAVRRAAADADKILAERQAVTTGTLGRTPTNADADRVLNGLVAAREQITDRRARIQAVEKEVERLQGSPLTLDQRAWMRSRVYEGNPDVALAKLERQVSPAWEALGAKNLPLLDAFAEQMDNVDKAAAAGRHALDRIIEQDPRRIAGQARLEQAQSALRMRERMDQLAQNGGDAATQQVAQRNLRAAQRSVDRAQKAYDEAELVAREAQAQRAGSVSAVVAQERQFSGGARAQEEAAIREAWRLRLGPELSQKLFDAADAMYAATRDLRQHLAQAGTFSQEQADFLDQSFPHYVPTKILDHVSDQALENLPPGGRSFSVGSNGLKRLTEAGTEKARMAPTSSFVDAMFQGERMAEKNAIVRTVAGWADVPGMESFVRKVDGDTAAPKGWKPVSYWDDGQKQRILVAAQLEPALQLGTPQLTGLAGVALKAMVLPLQLGATALRPSFIAFNMGNDLLWTLYRFAVEAPHPVEALRGVTDVLHGYRASFGGDPALVQRARESGASIGLGSRYETPGLIVRQLAGEHVWVRPVETAQGWQTLLSSAAGATSDIAGLVWSRPLGVLSRRVERAPRLAAFARAERQGADPIETAFRYRTSTADFSAGGTLMKQLNQMTPFVNATMQFGTEFVNLTRAHPKASALALSSLVTGTVLNELYNRSVAPDDYADVPEYVKDSGWVMMSDQAPEGQGKRGLVYVPLRGGFGAVVPLVRATMRAMYGEDPRVWQSLYQVIQAQSPVEPDVSSLVPPVAQTALEAASNYDYFRQRPIVPAAEASLPPSEQANERTSQTARLLGQATGKSPLKIDYVARGISPGPAEVLLGVADTLIRATGNALPEAPAKGEPGARDLPVVGGIVGRYLKTAGNERQNQAYEAADAIMEAKRPIVLEAVKQSQAYWNATPDRRDTLLRSAESELQKLAREMAGVLTEPKDTGLPARYVGVEAGSALEREIARAIDTPAGKRTVRQSILAGQYKGLRNPLYKAAAADETAESAAVRKTVKDVFP